MLPWLMERGEVPVAEMAERFQIDEEELVRDLELAAMCGLPPFVDEMIDVFIDEGMVYAGVPRLFTRPLRLTAPEGFALLVAGRVAMQLPGADADGALARALRQAGRGARRRAVVVESPPAAGHRRWSPRLPTAASGCASRYWSPAATSRTEREITPRRVFVDRGDWYVIADDQPQRRGAHVPHRPDRVVRAHRRGRRAARGGRPRRRRAGSTTPTCPLPGCACRRAAGGWPSATRLGRCEPTATAGWSSVPVASERWLRDLLLRLGADAEVLATARVAHVGADAAAVLLARYASATGTGNTGS